MSRYRIVHELGSGGMGVVYEAEDLRLHRRVALKFLSPELSRDPRVAAQLEREARAASALNHQNICTIHDIDESDGDRFIVMELLQGRTLGALLRDRPLHPPAIRDLAAHRGWARRGASPRHRASRREAGECLRHG